MKLTKCKAIGKYDRIFISGNFNFRSLTWENNILKIDQNLTGQQQKLAMLTSKYNLFNAVTQPKGRVIC